MWYKLLSFLKINTINQIWIKPTEWYEYASPQDTLLYKISLISGALKHS